MAFNFSLVDKPTNVSNKNLFVDGFVNMDVDRIEAIHFINQGYAFSPQYNGRRKADNFKAAGYVAIDVDKGMSLEEALADPFVQECASIVYTTPNHRINGNGDRFRILFETAKTIYDPKEYALIQRALLRHFAKADQSTKDAARFFFGSKGSNPIPLDGILTETKIDKLVLLYPDPPKPEHKRETQAWKDKTISPEEAKRMLSYIPPKGDYADWFRICAAITGYYGELGLQLIEEWSPDYKTDGRAVERILSYNNGEISMRTVIYEAKKYGYELPAQYKLKPDVEKPGPLVLENLYGDGIGYRNIGGHLHEYKDGFYQKCDEDAVKKSILEYFSKNQPRYSDIHNVNNALSYVKAACHIDQAQVNPPGLNVANGFVQISYDENNRPVPVLVEHSLDIVCDYKASFSYDPEADPTTFDNALDQMVPDEYQPLLLRNLAASMDLERVRRIRDRDVRLLLLIGQGSNGKDTLREWVNMLYCGNGMTNVSLQSFHMADTGGRAFNLAPLATSRVNWCSENVVGKLADCQQLKLFATGDEMWVEKKGIQGKTITPKAIGLFNLNEKPVIDTNQEAIRSRYAMIPFPNSFKTCPDPNKPYEKLADPRLKHDKVHISKNILPAFLNRLLVELGKMLNEGVDYSINNDFFQEVMESGNHFSSFVKEAGLVECSVQQGLRPSEMFELYETWAEYSGYLAVTTYYGKIEKRPTHPSKTDLVISHNNRLGPALERCFPNIQKKVVGNGTKYSVCCEQALADSHFVASLPEELRVKYYLNGKLGDEWQQNGDCNSG